MYRDSTFTIATQQQEKGKVVNNNHTNGLFLLMRRIRRSGKSTSLTSLCMGLRQIMLETGLEIHAWLICCRCFGCQ